MPDGVERTVRLGLMTYIRPDGAPSYAMEGATILVHADHVARFDELNVPDDAGQLLVNTSALTFPPSSGPGSGVDVWREFAVAQGHSEAQVAHMSRDRIRQLLGDV